MNKKIISRIFKMVIKRYPIRIALVLILSVLSTLFVILWPLELGKAITEILTGVYAKINGTGSINIANIQKILITVAILFLISSIFTVVQEIVLGKIVQKTMYLFRNEIIEKTAKLPLSYFETKQTGDILSVITTDVDTLEEGITKILNDAVINIIKLVGFIYILTTISIYMTAIALISLVLSGILIGYVFKKSQKYYKNNQSSIAEISGKITEDYQAVEIITGYNALKNEKEKFNTLNLKLYQNGWKAHFTEGTQYALMTFLGTLTTSVVIVVGAYLTYIGRMTIGNIQASVQYITDINTPVVQIAQMIGSIQKMLAAGERIFSFLDEKEEKHGEKRDNENEIIKSVKGNIEFKNVYFGYKEGKENEIIKNFNLKVEKGDVIAIVGHTGAGKTTITKLLQGLYRLNSGKILIDGIDIETMSKELKQSIFTIVTQDTWLFKGSIKDNIKYGKKGAKKQDYEKAAEMAHLSHLINGLPEGYNTEINEEADNISAGQRQLITIARALTSKRPILILDEATSNVDTRTENIIQKAIDKLMEDRTTFVIAHRLSTIKNANKIIVMDKGEIVEIGTHDELLTKNGKYSKLYNSQFKE